MEALTFLKTCYWSSRLFITATAIQLKMSCHGLLCRPRRKVVQIGTTRLSTMLVTTRSSERATIGSNTRTPLGSLLKPKILPIGKQTSCDCRSRFGWSPAEVHAQGNEGHTSSLWSQSNCQSTLMLALSHMPDKLHVIEAYMLLSARNGQDSKGVIHLSPTLSAISLQDPQTLQTDET